MPIYKISIEKSNIQYILTYIVIDETAHIRTLGPKYTYAELTMPT